LAAGCSEYIAKPVTTAALRDALAPYLAQTAITPGCISEQQKTSEAAMPANMNAPTACHGGKDHT
jgi:hypothetical protein